MKKQIKEIIEIAAFTSLLILGATATLNLALKKLKNPNRSYSAFVAPYSYVSANYKKAGLSKSDIKQLLIETSPSQGWKYQPVTGFTETARRSKFVNISELGFRLNSSHQPSDESFLSKDTSQERIYFFGGSTTFGYGVTDKQTIPAQLQLERPDSQVFNFGRGYYFSEQENHLLDGLLNNGAPKPDLAIFLDGLNEGCAITTYQEQLAKLFERASSQDYNWHADEALKPFLYAISKAKNKLGIQSQTVGRDVKQNTCRNMNLPPIPFSEVFAANLRSRESICKKHGIKCLTFLQPLPGIQSIHNHINPEFKSALARKYKQIKPLLQSGEFHFLDISSSLSTIKNHAYIDDVHYSPEANTVIAKSINAAINKSTSH